jgi:hypothetical protein
MPPGSSMNQGTRAAAILLVAATAGGCMPSGPFTPWGSTRSSSGDAGGPRDAGARPDARVPGCTAVAPSSCDEPALRFRDVEPIVVRSCQPCHSHAAGRSWPLETYEHVADWHDDVRADLVNCTMPPVDSGVAMTDGERRTLLMWIRCGYPE